MSEITAAPPRPTGVTPPRAARVAVAFLFTLAGLGIGGWASRVPDVKRQVGADEALWGTLSIGLAIGVLVSMSAVALLIARIGPRRLALTAAPFAIIAPALNGAATEPWVLACGLVLQGAAVGMLQAPMNAQAVRVEHEYGRPILTSFHACFSLGALGGALLGAGAAALGLAPAVQLAGTGAVLAVVLLATARHLPADEVVPPRDERPRGRFSPRLALLAAVAFAALFAEGSVTNWSAIYARESVGTDAAWAAATYAGFASTMAIGRLFGDRARARLGTTVLLVGGGLVGAAGVGVALATHTTVGAVAGFAVAGLGLASVVPVLYSLAGNVPGVSPGRGVALMALGTWPASLIAPPLIGWAAHEAGLRLALVVVVVCATAVAVVAATALRRPPAPRRPSAPRG